MSSQLQSERFQTPRPRYRIGFRGSLPFRSEPPTWDRDLAYAVGLLATDGSIAANGRQINFSSTDRELVETFFRCLRRPPSYRVIPPRAMTVVGRPAKVREFYIGQFRDRVLADWLDSIGVRPRKSRTIREVAVPDAFFSDFVRGLLDGDGSVIVYTSNPVPNRNPLYKYERLVVVFYSGSHRHLEWLKGELARLYDVRSSLHAVKRDNREPLYHLVYAKHASIRLLSKLYEDPDAPRLARKWKIWGDYCRRNGIGGP